jgi:drug/metabolite transporter (DMT)-like permease
MRRLSTDLLLLFTAVAWAFNITAIKYALGHGFSPLAYTAPRLGIAAVIFVAFAYWRERSIRIRRQDVGLVVGAGLVGIFLNQLALVYGLDFAQAATVALVFGAGPVLTGLAARLFGTELLSARSWVAALTSFGGVGLIALASGGRLSGSLGGVLLALGTTACWALYSVAVGSLLRTYSPLRVNALTTLTGSVPLLLVAIVPIAREPWGTVTPLAWLAWLYGLVVAWLVTTAVWFIAVRRIGASRVSLYGNIEPFLAALFAVLVLSERLDALEIAGGAVIAAGVVIGRQGGPQAA